MCVGSTRAIEIGTQTLIAPDPNPQKFFMIFFGSSGPPLQHSSIIMVTTYLVRVNCRMSLQNSCIQMMIFRAPSCISTKALHKAFSYLIVKFKVVVLHAFCQLNTDPSFGFAFVIRFHQKWRCLDGFPCCNGCNKYDKNENFHCDFRVWTDSLMPKMLDFYTTAVLDKA